MEFFKIKTQGVPSVKFWISGFERFFGYLLYYKMCYESKRVCGNIMKAESKTWNLSHLYTCNDTVTH